MVNYKISISGKAGSGKDTLAKLLCKELWLAKMSFAEPVKQMAMIMFPELPRKFFYGPSIFRNETIPNSFKEGQPLTIRQLLIDIGTNLGRGYNDSLWLNNFDQRVKKLKHGLSDNIVVTDTRFRNEFDHLKNKGYFHIRIFRDNKIKIDNVSEIEQDEIKNSEFDYVLNNNGTKQDLKDQVAKILKLLK